MQAASARTYRSIYLPVAGKVTHSFSPIKSDFAIKVTLSARRGAEGHAIGIVRVVVIVGAVRIHIVEITGVVSRAEPPNRGVT